MTVKTICIAGWASLASLLLVITTSLTLRWVPRRSVSGCIIFNGLVLHFTETINLLRWHRGVHGPTLCLSSFFSACYVLCFLRRKVVALRDTFLTYIFVVCVKYEGVSVYLQFWKSSLCNEGVQWSAILFENAKIVSLECLACLGLDMLFETSPVLADVFLLFYR